MPIDRTFRTALMLASLALAPSVHAAEAANDHDGDGFESDQDCDDANANVHPDAAETVVDSDCDGAGLRYVDADGDDIPGDGVDQDCDGANAVAADTESDPVAGVDDDGDDDGGDDDGGASAALAADDEPESDATGCAAGGTRRDGTGVLALLMAPLLRRRVKKAA
jgi:hypothetical protein